MGSAPLGWQPLKKHLLSATPPAACMEQPTNHLSSYHFQLLCLSQNQKCRGKRMNDDYFKNKQVEPFRKNPFKFWAVTPDGLTGTLVSAEAAATQQPASPWSGFGTLGLRAAPQVKMNSGCYRGAPSWSENWIPPLGNTALGSSRAICAGSDTIQQTIPYGHPSPLLSCFTYRNFARVLLILHIHPQTDRLVKITHLLCLQQRRSWKHN